MSKREGLMKPLLQEFVIERQQTITVSEYLKLCKKIHIHASKQSHFRNLPGGSDNKAREVF